MDDLQQLETWLAPLLATIEPGARGQLARKIGMAVRRSQSARIARQENPDGSAFAPRRKALRSRAGRIKRGAMFAKLRQAKHLKVTATSEEAAVGFIGRAARIARVHQDGLSDEVRPGGPRIRYEQRRLLGFSAGDVEMIRSMVFDHLAS